MISDLPTELLQIIGENIARHNPKDIIPLMTTCKRFEYLFKPLLYKDIWAVVCADDYFQTNCSFQSISDEILKEETQLGFKHRTLIISIRSLKKLTELLMRRDDLVKLVGHIHVNILNFDQNNNYISVQLNNCIEKNIQEQNGLEFSKQPVNKYIKNSNLDTLKLAIFESAIKDFFTNSSYGRTKSLVDFDINSKGAKEKKATAGLLNIPSSSYFDIDQELIRRLLFCPYDIKSISCDLIAIHCVDELLNLFKVRKEKLQSYSCSILNFQRMMSQSTIPVYNPEEISSLNFSNFYCSS